MSVEVNALSFGYSESRSILNGITMRAFAGEILAIVGPSGSGKSTLLRLIAGVLPRRGSANRIDGKVLLDGAAPEAGLLKPGTVSLMFQEPMLLPNRTVKQNIALPLEMLREGPEVVVHRVVRDNAPDGGRVTDSFAVVTMDEAVGDGHVLDVIGLHRRRP